MLLDATPAKNVPLEREYEGWVVRGMQDYFEMRGIPFLIYAFSPYDEKPFPADEIAKISAFKAFALQFKRPNFHKYGISWEITEPQHSRLCVQKSIYYALPTFRNRRDHKVALHHTLFAHPSWSSPYLGEPIFTQDSSLKIYQEESKMREENFPENTTPFYSLRWGALVEAIEGCYLGTLIPEFEKNVDNVVAAYRSEQKKLKEAKDFLAATIYAVFIGKSI